jgi:hypothetical protein
MNEEIKKIEEEIENIKFAISFTKDGPELDALKEKLNELQNKILCEKIEKLT